VCSILFVFRIIISIYFFSKWRSSRVCSCLSNF